MALIRNLNTKHLVILLLGLALVGLIFVRFFILTPEEVEKELSHDVVSQVHSRSHHYDNKTAFAFGGNGLYSTRELFKCMSAMESLSKIGGWKGDIYFLVDKTDCIDKKILKSLGNSNVHVIKIDDERYSNAKQSTTSAARHSPHHLQGSANATHRKLLSQAPFERSMAIKTHILDYIDNPTIELVLWYDCDVLFVKQDCVSHMLAKKPHITLERPIFVPNNSHVGSVAVNNSVSRPALQQWREGILAANSFSSVGNKKEAVQDYKVFNKLFGSDHTKPDAKFGLFDPIWRDNFAYSLPGNGSIYDYTTQCALHLSSGRCNHLGAEAIHQVVKNYHLKAYENHYWCPNTNERNMKKYGFDWPFCWNPPFLFDHYSTGPTRFEDESKKNEMQAGKQQ